MKWVVRAALAATALTAAGLAAVRYVPAVQHGIVSGIIDRAMSKQVPDLLAPDALRVAICGSGSPMPDLARSPACNVVFAAGRAFVVDAGNGSWMHAMRWQMPMGAVGAVLLTHFHSDHIGDLGEVNLQSWVGQRQAPLVVYGGPGIERVVAGFNEAYAMDRSHRTAHHGAEFLKPELGPMEARRVANAAGGALTGEESVVIYDAGGLTITAFAVDHEPISPSYGYRFDYKGRSVVFSGDTARTHSIAVHARGADVLIHEAMLKDVVGEMEKAAEKYGRSGPAKILHDIPDYHASPRDAADEAAEAGVGHLVLSHVIPPIPQWLGERLFLRDLGDSGIDTRLGFDGMLITLPAGSTETSFDDLGR
jgi:ribonuclease Z